MYFRWFVKYVPLSDDEVQKLIEERKKSVKESESEEEEEGGSKGGSSAGKDRPKKGLVRSASVRTDSSISSSKVHFFVVPHLLA